MECEGLHDEQAVGSSPVSQTHTVSSQGATPPSPHTVSPLAPAQLSASPSARHTLLASVLMNTPLNTNTVAQSTLGTAVDGVQNVNQILLKKNKPAIAKNDALCMESYIDGGQAEGSSSANQQERVYPAHSQSPTLAAGHQSRRQVSSAQSLEQFEDGQMSTDADPLGKLLRPKSPTQQCSVPKKDRSHISLALMESHVGSQESEEIFHVQQHEMVCAVSSQTQFMDADGRLVSSVDMGLYWCNFCPFSTANKSVLVQHVVEHRFHCKHCRYQSFSRADVIHHSFHSHAYFQEVGAITQYCTLLSDYLRIQHLKRNDAKRCQKRKAPAAHDSDDDHEHEQPSSNKINREEKYCEDYVLSDVGIHDIEEEEVGKAMRAQPKNSRSNSVSSDSSCLTTTSSSQLNETSTPLTCDPVSTVAGQTSHSHTSPPHPDGRDLPVTAQVLSKPPALDAEIQASDCTGHNTNGGCDQWGPDSHTPPPSSHTPPLLDLNVSCEGASQQMHTNMYWRCGYCQFTCATEGAIKDHLGHNHSGKPHKVVSLMKLEDSYTPVPSDLDCKAEASFDTDQILSGDSAEATVLSDNEGLPQLDCSTSECDEPPVLVKQEPLQVKKVHAPIKLRFPSPRFQSKHSASFRCYHCEFRARFFGTLRSHILDCHKGQCLIGLGGMKSLVFMCPRFGCSFRSWSGKTFLNHARVCTPWTEPEAVHIPAEAHLMDCLQATMCLAELPSLCSSSVKVASPSKKAFGKYSCLYCKNQFTASKSRTKQHILNCHASQSLLMRDVHAHSKRRRSSIFFCRWCPWEGERKTEHDHHAIFCPLQTAPPISHEGAAEIEGAAESEGTENQVSQRRHSASSDIGDDAGEDDCDDAAEKDDNDDANSLEPPDIIHDQEHFEDGTGSNICAAIKTDNASGNGDCETRNMTHTPQSSKGTLQDGAVFNDNFLSCSNIASSDSVFATDNISSDSAFSADKSQSAIGSGLECLRCDVYLNSLAHLRDHMQTYHSQHVSFPFRSVYHKEKHNKSKFFACPSPECSAYRYSEADTVHHYKLHHTSQPHPYLDPSYSPAPVVFRRRTKPCNPSKILKPPATFRIPKVQVEASEKPFLCLYCDQYFYTETVSEMKTHHLSCHPGQAITVRDVKAFRYKKASRLAVCDQPLCDFKTYKPEQLAYHVAAQHSTQPPEMLLADHSFQCVSCGWITTDDSIVQEHVSMVHEGDGGATVVTLAHGDDQGTVEERFIFASVSV